MRKHDNKHARVRMNETERKMKRAKETEAETKRPSRESQ